MSKIINELKDEISLFGEDKKAYLGNRLFEQLNRLGLLLFVFSMSLPGTNNFLKKFSLGLIVVSALVIWVKRRFAFPSLKERNTIFLMSIMVFYLLGYLYFFWDEYTSHTLWVQERKLSLFLIPFSLLITSGVKHSLKKIIDFMVLGCWFAVLFISFNIILDGNVKGAESYFTHFNRFRAWHYIHHVSFNMMMNFAIAGLSYLLAKRYRYMAVCSRIYYILSFVVFSVFLLKTEGRMGELTYLTMVSASVYYYHKHRGKFKAGVASLICFIISGFIFLDNPRMENAAKTVEKTVKEKITDIRAKKIAAKGDEDVKTDGHTEDIAAAVADSSVVKSGETAEKIASVDKDIKIVKEEKPENALQKFKGLPRIYIWQKSMEVIKDHPIMGNGIGRAQAKLNAFYREIDFKVGYNNNYHSHNQLLQSWSQFGIAGLLLTIFILLYPLYYFVKEKKGGIVLFAWFVFSFGCITEPLLQIVFGVFLFCVYLFLLYACDDL